MNILGAALVALVLVLNLTRLGSVIALSASGLVTLYLWRAWVGRGRPGARSRPSVDGSRACQAPGGTPPIGRILPACSQKNSYPSTTSRMPRAGVVGAEPGEHTLPGQALTSAPS